MLLIQVRLILLIQVRLMLSLQVRLMLLFQMRVKTPAAISSVYLDDIVSLPVSVPIIRRFHTSSLQTRRHVIISMSPVCVCFSILLSLLAVSSAGDGSSSYSFIESCQNCLTVPRCRLGTYGCRAFYYAGPSVWNSLPDELRNSGSFDSFKQFLKTILFILFSRY